MKKKTKERGPITRIDPPADRGLEENEVQERHDAGYGNKVNDKNEKSTGQIIFKNVFTFFNIILMTIAVIFAVFITYLYSTGNAEVVDKHFGFSKFLFLIPAIMNVTIGTAQELHSRKIIKNLRIVSEAKSKVMRAGVVQTVDAHELVIDDLVVLSGGDQATADLTVLSGEVSVDESMLTGESDYIKKRPGDKILSGSAVIMGEARARVIEVGDETYAAKLSAKVKSVEGHKSELMTGIFKIIRALTIALVVVEAVVITTLVYKISAHGGDASVFDMQLRLSDPIAWARIMITGGSFGVGMIPSGLVLTTSVTLMLSIVQLSRKQTLIQELYSLENLSRVDVICLDKTGTLTDGTMTVRDVRLCEAHLEDVEYHARALMASIDNRNATAQAVFERFGALDKPVHSSVIPFSSETKSSGIVYPDGSTLLMGAPEYLLPKNDERIDFISEKAKEGFRVLALKLDQKLLCIFVIEDHIRESAYDTLRFFKENSVEVKIISGDNPLTVSKIAQICGVENADNAISLEDVPLEKIPEIAEEYAVFARVSPEQKEALVVALKEKGHKVAMTGDGVNDILALRKADSSITFAKATEAAKSCSDVVLMDNDFSHLKEVVGEGRRVIGNVQRTAVLFLMKSIAIIVLAFALIPLSAGQMWFSIENAYMLEAAVIGTGGFLLSLEARRKPNCGSFLKNISLKSLASGGLAAIAILLPILLYVIPASNGATPLLQDKNVRTVMSLLMFLAGGVVLFVMCIPFTRYRAFAIAAVLAVAVALGFMLPTSYIGGQPTGGGMFAFDSSIGQTFMDSVFMREFMRPWNSAVVQNLIEDPAIYQIVKLFLFAAVPLFIVIFDIINCKIEGGKKEKGGIFSPLHIGKIMMLISGVVLMINALLQLGESIVNIVTDTGGLKESEHAALIITVHILIALIFLAVDIFLGVSACKVWKTGKLNYVNKALLNGGILLVFVILKFFTVENGRQFAAMPTLERVNLVFVDIFITALYVAGALVVHRKASGKTTAPRKSGDRG